MAQLNENLIRAMVWDLKEVVDISIMLSSWVGKIDCMSWRYPSKQSQSVNVLSIFSQLNGSAGEYYINLLEFIYDRLLLILNLLIKFVDNFPNILIDFHMAKNVIRPQNLSLGGLLNIFWTRMQSLQNCMIDFMAKQSIASGEKFQVNGSHQAKSSNTNISYTVVSRNCQTDIISLASCENCHLCEELMRKIITWIEYTSLDVHGKSAVANLRQETAEEIPHITQWQSMSSWATAIVEDLHNLLATFKDASKAKASLTELIQTTHKKWEKKCNGYQKRITDLRTQCRDLQENLVETENKHQHVDKQCWQTISDKENSYKILEKKMKLTDAMLAESEAKEKATESALAESQRQLLAAVGENKQLADRVAELRLEQQQQDAKSAKDELKAIDLQAENAELRDLVARLEQRVSDLEGSKVGRAEKLAANLAEDMPRLSLESQAQLEGKAPNLASVAASTEGSKVARAKLQGNPMKDMLGQIQVNQVRIEKLQAENARIAKTLYKLQAFNARKATTENASS